MSVLGILNNIADLFASVIPITGRRIYSSISEASFLTEGYFDIFGDSFDETTKTKAELRVAFAKGILFDEEQIYFVEAEPLITESTPRLFAKVKVVAKLLDPPMYTVLQCDFMEWVSL